MTEEPKWTPGPWHVGAKTVYAGGIPIVEPDYKHSIKTVANVIIAETIARGWSPPWQEEHDATARLIAAAPEMAELLERIVHDVGMVFGHPDLEADMDSARNLLNRIHGENEEA